jgi:hypothetical protein
MKVLQRNPGHWNKGSFGIKENILHREPADKIQVELPCSWSTVHWILKTHGLLI